MTNVSEFPLIKTIDADESLQIASRLGAKQGVLLFECPCGCGRIKCMEVGEPSHRDLLFYAKNLENYAMEEYVAEVEDVSEDEIS